MQPWGRNACQGLPIPKWADGSRARHSVPLEKSYSAVKFLPLQESPEPGERPGMAYGRNRSRAHPPARVPAYALTPSQQSERGVTVAPKKTLHHWQDWQDWQTRCASPSWTWPRHVMQRKQKNFTHVSRTCRSINLPLNLFSHCC